MPAAVIIPELAYADVVEASAWLCAAFGFKQKLIMGHHRAQLVFGTGALVVTQKPAGASGVSDHVHSIMVRVADVDRHHAQAVAHGAKVIRPLETHFYGERQYAVEDPGGHVWTFSQTMQDIDPSAWLGLA